MSYNSGRRAPNTAQFMRALNMQEPAADDTLTTEEDLQKELAMFTNTNFFDFDSGRTTDYQASPPKPEPHPEAVKSVSTASTAPATSENGAHSTDSMMMDFSGLDDLMTGDFNFPEYGSTYTSPTVATFHDSIGNLPPIQPSSHGVYPAPASQPHAQGYVPPSPASHTASGEAHLSEMSTPTQALTFEEQSRRLAEEDKRRRNTAASARFRIKKKQREQALEKSAKEMTDKVNALENRISTLETENKWLRSLVMDKHNDSGKEEMAKLLSLGKGELSKLLRLLPAPETSSDAHVKEKGSDTIVAKGNGPAEKSRPSSKSAK